MKDRVRIICIDIFLVITTCIAALSYFIAVVAGEVSYMIGNDNTWPFAILITVGWFATVVLCLLERFVLPHLANKRLDVLRTGWHQLLTFLVSCTIVSMFCIYGMLGKMTLYVKHGEAMIIIPGIKDGMRTWILVLICLVCAEALVFWNGMLRIFFTSEQLAIKWRVIAVLCGLIPLVNLTVLVKMMIITGEEIDFEQDRILREEKRKSEQVCKTKYPIFMVHGIFFRDFEHLNYWGRIPKALEENGATIYYGDHMSSASIEKSAEELVRKLQILCEERHFDKVNVIAHSKGGLDMRYAISKLGADKYVASLTTINTPHRGCIFAEYLLNKIPEEARNTIADKYNEIFRKLGDEDPNFLEGVSNLTFGFCEQFNKEVKDVKGIMYNSVGSKLNRATNGRFPLNMSHPLVKHFDGENDGLVGEDSFKWGSKYTYLTVKGRRGISHADMIDLNRENIPGFDVREFYINLVHDLKNKGF